MRSIDGPDNIEKGIELKVVELASNTADRFTAKISEENVRWGEQMAQFKLDGIDEKHPRWKAAEKTHDLIVSVNEDWLATLKKAANR
jgi:hypothetical protein